MFGGRGLSDALKYVLHLIAWLLRADLVCGQIPILILATTFDLCSVSVGLMGKIWP